MTQARKLLLIRQAVGRLDACQLLSRGEQRLSQAGGGLGGFMAKGGDDFTIFQGYTYGEFQWEFHRENDGISKDVTIKI